MKNGRGNLIEGGRKEKLIITNENNKGKKYNTTKKMTIKGPRT